MNKKTRHNISLSFTDIQVNELSYTLKKFSKENITKQRDIK
jgi:hypothetical protein